MIDASVLGFSSERVIGKFLRKDFYFSFGGLVWKTQFIGRKHWKFAKYCFMKQKFNIQTSNHYQKGEVNNISSQGVEVKKNLTHPRGMGW